MRIQTSSRLRDVASARSAAKGWAVIHIVLFQPEIPHNTGAVGRLCLATGSRLHLIRPLGFSLDDKQLKRAGLDYWPEVDVRVWDSFDEMRKAAGPGAAFFFLTTKATHLHWDAPLTSDECYLVFGPETRGLPETLLAQESERAIRIPMQGTRSLNLATAVGIVMYEAMRQREVKESGNQNSVRSIRSAESSLTPDS